MPSNGNCNTATCRSRQWQSSSRRPTKPRPGRLHVRRETDRGVDGTNAPGSIAMPRSGPNPARRCAEGAGLDGGDRGRSTINRAVHRAADTQLHRRYGSDRFFAYITNLHQLDRRDQARRVGV